MRQDWECQTLEQEIQLHLYIIIQIQQQHVGCYLGVEYLERCS